MRVAMMFAAGATIVCATFGLFDAWGEHTFEAGVAFLAYAGILFFGLAAAAGCMIGPEDEEAAATIQQGDSYRHLA